jgi:uncharacterized protein
MELSPYVQVVRRSIKFLIEGPLLSLRRALRIDLIRPKKLRFSMTPLKLEPCLPPRWAGNGHLQTLLGHLLPSPKLSLLGQRHEIILPDGDRLVGFFHEGDSKTVVYLFHGLSGTSDADYIHRTALVSRLLGHSVFLVNHRGCGAGAGLAKKPYHSGRAEDLSAVIAYGKKLRPGDRHVAIGFSLSGNALLLLLSGRRGDIKPDAAISVNAPIHLEKAAYALKRGFNRIYDLRFVHKCRKEIAHRFEELPAKYRVSPFSTLHDFDDIYTAPEGGFKNREDYYQSCSTKGLLSEIQIPTIMITAKDDPFVSFEDYVEAKKSKMVHLHIENVGGHMGYLSRQINPLGSHRWLDYALYESLKLGPGIIG